MFVSLSAVIGILCCFHDAIAATLRLLLLFLLHAAMRYYRHAYDYFRRCRWLILLAAMPFFGACWRLLPDV